MKKSVAITGTGVVCAIGMDRVSVCKSLREGISGIGPSSHLETQHNDLPVGEVKMSNAEMKRLLGIDGNQEVSRTTLLGAIALRQALEEAGLEKTTLKGQKVVFISGTTVGGMDVTERHYRSMIIEAEHARHVKRHDCGSNTLEIAELCNLECKACTISTACSSALNAIILGTRMLLNGEADIVIAGGAESLSRFHLNGFNSLMILDKDHCRPFDESRKGLNLGEGAGYVVIQRTEDISCTQNILAYIAGYGNRCDAHHQTATSPEGEGAYLAMRDALDMAGFAPEAIDYVNAHGTGTPDNDRSESFALRRIFGEKMPAVTSTKSYTGHTTSASGSIETILSLLAMKEAFIPQSVGWEASSEDCIIPSGGLSSVSLHNVICNSFGFGGNDSSLILSDHEILLPCIVSEDTYVASECEVHDDVETSEVRKYVSPMEMRRMSKILKASLYTSMEALNSAGVSTPDAIIIATRYGMLEQGEKILDYLEDNGETGLSPTLFMQSTHNTLAGSLAIRLGCHGYNVTYSHGAESLAWALTDANRLISEGRAETVLVGLHDYYPEKFGRIMEMASMHLDSHLVSRSMVIKKR